MSHKYDVVIGLEVHVQLATNSKIFCSCATKFGASPNSQVCPVCAGLPGVLPVLNRQVFELGLRAVLALNGNVTKNIKFDRKNYFYPDLPKNYQISQFDLPVGRGGHVEISTPSGPKKIQLTRVHLEEDAGKLIHDDSRGLSFVDFNRAGTPLIEIVSEPELKSPDEAYAYLVNLKAIMKAIGVSEVNMEMGHLRCDANISLRRKATDPLGVKVELKNLNSFKFVKAALHYEISRQAETLDEGQTLAQETRLWDDRKGKSFTMRSKEEAHDYRFFPEPDLVPFEVDQATLQRIQKEMPELPDVKKKRFMNKYNLSDYDTDLILHDDVFTATFEDLAVDYQNYKNLVNWMTGPIAAFMNENRFSTGDLQLPKKSFLELLQMVDKGEVSLKVSREIIFPELMKSKDSPRKIAEAKKLSQISDKGSLETVVLSVLDKHKKSVEDYKAGKVQALSFLMGQVMRETKGKANPNLVNQLMKEKLKN
jgi:aspartyl-tRNA(Asn)/glutamyl-tRNA(Gln) amidotransferase subunit B